MRAWLQVDVAGTFANQILVGDIVYGVHFGMRASIFAMPSLANDPIVVDNDTSYHRIGAHATHTAKGELHRPAHKNLVCRVIVFGHGSILAKL
jgi:hypothetical protein